MTHAKIQHQALPHVLAQADLREISREITAERFSPLGNEPFLLFHADATGIPTRDRERIDAWLRSLHCPVIGIAGGDSDHALADACDVVLGHHDESAPLAASIRKCPIAASVFVQLLRASARLPVADALTMESLAYATLQGGPEHRRWLEAHRSPSPVAASDEGPPVILAREGELLSLELNRPSIRNAISVEVRDALVEALQLVLADDSILAVRISGRGKCFSVGGDLTEFGSVPDPATGHVIRNLVLPGRLLAQCAERVDFHVHSACIGAGIELPAFGRRIVAAHDSFIQLPELGLGLIPGAGGCVSIPRRIGRQRTAYLVLSGRRINAQTALAWGLVDEIRD